MVKTFWDTLYIGICIYETIFPSRTFFLQICFFTDYNTMNYPLRKNRWKSKIQFRITYPIEYQSS